MHGPAPRGGRFVGRGGQARDASRRRPGQRGPAPPRAGRRPTSPGATRRPTATRWRGRARIRGGSWTSSSRDLGEEAARRALSADDSAAPLYVWVNPFRATDRGGDGGARRGRRRARALLPGGLPADRTCRRGGARAAPSPRASCSSPTPRRRSRLSRPARTPARSSWTRQRDGERRPPSSRRCRWPPAAPADLRALDIHEFKTGILKRRMAELGVPGVTVAVADAGHPLDRRGVPPAGVGGGGTARRAVQRSGHACGAGPRSDGASTPADIAELAALQLRLLRGVAPLVAPGRPARLRDVLGCPRGERRGRGRVPGRRGRGPFRAPLAGGTSYPRSGADGVGPDGQVQDDCPRRVARTGTSSPRCGGPAESRGRRYSGLAAGQVAQAPPSDLDAPHGGGRVGWLGALLAVVRVVEARALEDDADGREDAPRVASARRAAVPPRRHRWTG